MSETAVKKRAPNAGLAKPENSLVKRRLAAIFIVENAQGLSQSEIARRHNTTPSRVGELMRWAEREGFFDKADEAIRNRLVPLAIDVVERGLMKALETGETDAAMKLLYGIRVLASNGPTREDLRHASDEIGDAAEEMTWERFTLKRQQRLAQEGSNGQLHPSTVESSPAAEGAAGTGFEAVSALDAEVVCEECGEDGPPADSAE